MDFVGCHKIYLQVILKVDQTQQKPIGMKADVKRYSIIRVRYLEGLFFDLTCTKKSASSRK